MEIIALGIGYGFLGLLFITLAFLLIGLAWGFLFYCHLVWWVIRVSEKDEIKWHNILNPKNIYRYSAAMFFASPQKTHVNKKTKTGQNYWNGPCNYRIKKV